MDDRKQQLVTDSQNQPTKRPADPSLVGLLQNKIRKLETATRQGGDETVSTGSSLIDGLLPASGLPRGTLIEWFAPTRGCGSELLSLLAAREATRNGGALVVIDSQRVFYPPAAAAWGIDLDNTIVLRENDSSKMLWAIDQCLRSVAVAALWGELGKVDERWLRRFQLSAEDTGTLGLFTRPQSLRHLPSWAEIQWLIEPQSVKAAESEQQVVAPKLSAPKLSAPKLSATNLPATNLPATTAKQNIDKSHRNFRLHLMRCRGGLSGKSLDLRIDIHSGQIKRQTVTFQQDRKKEQGRRNDERIIKPQTPALRVASELADPAAGGRPARA